MVELDPFLAEVLKVFEIPLLTAFPALSCFSVLSVVFLQIFEYFIEVGLLIWSQFFHIF